MVPSTPALSATVATRRSTGEASTSAGGSRSIEATAWSPSYLAPMNEIASREIRDGRVPVRGVDSASSAAREAWSQASISSVVARLSASSSALDGLLDGAGVGASIERIPSLVDG
jgi:hypothetical protein